MLRTRIYHIYLREVCYSQIPCHICIFLGVVFLSYDSRRFCDTAVGGLDDPSTESSSYFQPAVVTI
ncbi:hypothetical protein VFPPC_15627 [Pochonia chlamydosporia 170]|uniref:Uncharacterized protein n=1 Tax=Pochonia chlamydosporia 170 TaxID=1380566 RepID=A0A179G0U9_METCM|nr:hypothetical protein VFPPC_15627 [Pochonia chlamydosporia 170]OAQ70859.1 hypothetical protein VFPPC_15627 [Pochonia chlamydosporia 170]